MLNVLNSANCAPAVIATLPPLHRNYDSFIVTGLDVFLFVGDNIVGVVRCKDFLGAKA